LRGASTAIVGLAGRCGAKGLSARRSAAEKSAANGLAEAFGGGANGFDSSLGGGARGLVERSVEVAPVEPAAPAGSQPRRLAFDPLSASSH
jgi:hypothetical protein